MEEVKFLSWNSSGKIAGQRKNKKHKKNMVSQKVEEKKKKVKKKGGLEEGTSERTKKKNKKKKNKKGMDDHFLLVQSENLECAQSKDGAQNPSHVTRVSKKKPQKKKVTFSLPKDFICAKHPQFTSTSPKKDVDVGNSEVVGQEDSPACSEDFNSQDLFITQKTFRTSPELESPEGPEESDELLQLGGLHKTSKEQEHKSRRSKVKHTVQKLKSSMKLEDDRPVSYLKSSSAFPQAWSSSSDPPPDQRRRMNSSTQTENFFTTELSSYHRFCQERADRSRLQSCRALDLRLSHRARNQHKHQNMSSPSLTSFNQKEMKNEQQELELELSQYPCLQSEFESKTVDTSTSSEDSAAKLDLTQVSLRKTVQTVHGLLFYKLL